MKFVCFNLGKYTTRVEIQRAASEDFPCRLEKTTVKIQFPDMRSEVFVNFLGYKEPNLMYLMRCKGVCGEGAGQGEGQDSPETNQIACTAPKVRVCVGRGRGRTTRRQTR